MLAALRNGGAWWLQKGEEPQTFVRQAFGGQLASKLQCESCQHEADGVEEFMDLSVEILHPPDEGGPSRSAPYRPARPYVTGDSSPSGTR
jgi:hypothetical protein